MGKDTVSRIADSRPAVDDRPPLPPLSKCIKSMKDRCYAVVRYVYLKEWKSYVVETKEFKLWVKPDKASEFYAYLERHLLKNEEIWICVDGLSYYPIYGRSSLHWANSESEKSVQCWLEGDALDRPLPDKDDTDNDLGF